MKNSIPKWLDKALDTFKFHKSKLQTHEKWTSTQTARSLGLSIGSVSEDLMIARWYRTHKEEIDKIEHARDVLKFIRAEEKKRLRDD